MPLVFPLTDLMDVAFIKSGSLNLIYRQEFSGTQGGVILVKDRGPELWGGSFQSDDLINGKARLLRSRLNALRGSLNLFYGWDTLAQYPAEDPDGARLGASVVQINSIGPDSDALSLKGLPAGYRLTEGDMLCFDYGSGPSRALHEVSEAAVADGNGVTPLFGISPNLRVGAQADLAVTLRRASALMRIVPGSVSLQTVNRYKSSLSFQAIQVL